MTAESDEYENQIVTEIRQIFTETVIDHASNPRNVGSITNADGFASITGPCGDAMEIWLKIRAGEIDEATFWTDGCSTTIACGSMATEMVKGKNTGQALAINQSEILKALGGLPQNNVHCALLAADTVKAAIQDYLALKREPWKKAYRT